MVIKGEGDKMGSDLKEVGIAPEPPKPVCYEIIMAYFGHT